MYAACMEQNVTFDLNQVTMFCVFLGEIDLIDISMISISRGKYYCIFIY